MNDLYNLRITSNTPITIHAIAMVNGEFRSTDMTVAEFTLLAEHVGKGVYQFGEIVAKLEAV